MPVRESLDSDLIFLITLSFCGSVQNLCKTPVRNSVEHALAVLTEQGAQVVTLRNARWLS